MLDFIKNISPVEWLVLLLIIVVLFGRGILVRLGKASGETLKEVKNVKKSFNDAIEGKDEEPQKKEV